MLSILVKTYIFQHRNLNLIFYININNRIIYKLISYDINSKYSSKHFFTHNSNLTDHYTKASIDCVIVGSEHLSLVRVCLIV